MSKNSRRDYDVGYGKPPREHQFRKGMSGNPRGRKKTKSARAGSSLAERVYEMSQDSISVTIKGQPTTMTVEAMLIHRLIQKAADGSSRHILQLLELLEKGREKHQSSMLPEDMERLRNDPLAAQRAYQRMLGMTGHKGGL